VVIAMTRIDHTRRTMQTMRTRLVPASLLALGIVPVVAGLVRLAGLMTGQASANEERFFESPVPVTLHILAVIPYSLLGALQFAPALRRRGWHRAVGVPLVPLGLIAALTGLWMAQFYPWPKGDGEALYLMRLIVGVAMTFSIVRGVVALRHHEYAAHGAWMLRGYALGMGAGTQVLTHLPWSVFVGGAPGEASRAIMMGLAWIINAIVAEYVIRTRLTAPVSVRPGRPRPVLVSTT
jgi:uncharacterized membrane protein